MKYRVLGDYAISGTMRSSLVIVYLIQIIDEIGKNIRRHLHIFRMRISL